MRFGLRLMQAGKGCSRHVCAHCEAIKLRGAQFEVRVRARVRARLRVRLLGR